MTTTPPGRDGVSSVPGTEPETIAVLHVDDEPSVSTMTADLLERQSDAIAVETESRAEEALDRLRDGDVDCVVSDHEMPGMDGIEFLRAVREAHGDLPFVLFTGRGSEEVASEAISAGVTDYLQKGTGVDQYTVLANRIENAVERYRTRRALERERTRRSALFENSPDPIMATAVEGDSLVVTEVNSAFEDHFGFEAREIVGRTVAESVIPERSLAEYEDIRERVLADEAVETEVRRQTDRGPREFLLRAIPFGAGREGPQGDYAWYTDITERKERERRLQALSGAFPDLAFIIDEDGRHVELLASPESEDLLYVDPDAIIGKRFRDVFPDERADEFRSVVQATLDTDRPQTLEYRLDVQAGTRWLEARTAPLATQIDGKRAVAWVTRDVTERKERELALRELHDIATGITGDDTRDDVCRRTIEAAAVVLDFDLSVINIEEDGELPVTALSDDLPPDGVTAMSVDEGLAGETYRTGESFLVDDVQAHAEAKPQGQYRSALSIPIGDHGVFQAVTEEPGSFDEDDLELAELLVSHTAEALDRLERERTLERNQRRYRAVFDTPTSLIGRLDLDGRVIDANRTAMDLVDRSIDDVAGEPFWETPWWSHAPELQAKLQTWISRAVDGEYVRFEAEHDTVDGDRIDVDGVLHPVVDEDGDPAEIVVAARDVTDAKERERALKRQNERLDEFVSVVSHDLRNPLNVLGGSLDLAEETGRPEDFDRCRRAVERMETLLDDLLTLAREGEPVEDPADVDLSGVVEACWETVETADASLRNDVDAVVRASRSRLRQLLENLFRNSVDHGGESVTITVGDLDGGFYVEDDGAGLPDHARDRLFESGFSTDPRGTGFGLSIAEEIADAHGWTITAVEGTDGGARFEVTGVEVA